MNVDAQTIGGALTGIKSALDIVKAIVGLRDGEAIRAKAIELQAVILDTLEKGIAAREAQAAQLDRVRELEEEVGNLKAWNREKDRYELLDLYRGLFSYVPKVGEERGEPPHALCANCYQCGIKSLLQTNGQNSVHEHSWDCPACKTKVKNQWRDMGQLIAKSREPRT